MFAMVLGVLHSCKKGNLDVENVNNPDLAQVYATKENIEATASGLYNTLYQASHSENGVQPMLSTASDNYTCSWGNFGMRDMSWEPRDFAWTNTAAYSYNTQTNTYYDNIYKAIVPATNIITSINGGKIVFTAAEAARAKAFCRFAMGVAYGNLALVFDRTFIVDETKTTEGKLSAASPYKEVAAAAIKYLDDAIAISTATSFTVPKAWLGTSADLSSADFVKLCNTSAARILAYLPRTKTELAAVDWAKVKTYADAGITTDFNVVVDDVVWYDNSAYYLGAGNSTWGLTDMYVVHMLDPVTQPAHWDDTAAFPYPPKSTNPLDKRLNTDFAYVTSNGFQVARGYYHFSSYRNTRYDFIYAGDWTGSKPEIMKAENDMIRAEARAYTSDPAGAATIINAGTYITRGQMTPVASVQADVINAIHHERSVELIHTGANISFYEMRKLDLLQKGTPLHLPLPAKLLEKMEEAAPYYTFGTTAKADGIGTSNKGWR
ncbi:putative outer membrane starch-binding protein [Pedobacter metabolipauper]|uniref:Putative outer membrane starch-binding protein n=2 Tax=Pedobacter metabolipauper TaxID=425513 RepID=A0A4R6SVV5_9SPHI|nr:putative outer membrane starch-binding protein [Pedobacter metabolipauper]